MSEEHSSYETDDQQIGRTIKTRHLDALRDLQKNEIERLHIIKSDPSRKLSRRYEPDGSEEQSDRECAKESLPVKQVWAGALKESQLTEGKRLAITRQASHYLLVGSGYVKTKIGILEKLIVLIQSSREKVDNTVKAGCRRMNQIVANSPRPTSASSPYVEASITDLTQNAGRTEMFLSGSTQAYQKNQLDEKSIAVLEQLIEANNGKPVALSCGIYSDEETVEQPIDITAVAIISNNILFVAVTIDPSAGHESDLNAYGTKKLKIFTTEGSINVLENSVEIVPGEGSSISVLPSTSSDGKESIYSVNLDAEFQDVEDAHVPEKKKLTPLSEDDSDGDDGDSDSSEDSEGEEDLALFLVEAGNLSLSLSTNFNGDTAVNARGKRQGSRSDFKITTHSQGTNTSLYNMGFQSKCALMDCKETRTGQVSSSIAGGEAATRVNTVDATSLPDSSSRRIRTFNLRDVTGVASSPSALVLQRNSDAVAFTGTLQSAITVEALDTKLLIVGDTSFEWSRAAAASGWMSKEPVRPYSGTRESMENEKDCRRFLRLRDNILRYDTADTLLLSQPVTVLSQPYISAKSPCSEKHSAPPPTGILKVLSEKSSPVSSGLNTNDSNPSVSFSSTIPSTPTYLAGDFISSNLSSVTDKLTDKLLANTPAAKTPVKGRRESLFSVLGAISGYGNATTKKNGASSSSSGEIEITRNSIVSLGQKTLNPFITITTPKETLSVRYEPFTKPPSMPYSPLGFDEDFSPTSMKSSVHTRWMREIQRAIAQQAKKSVLTAANRVESEWSHESPSFSCVAVDASVEQVYSCPPSSSSPSSSSRLLNMEDLKGEPSNLSSPVHHTTSASGLGSASRSSSSSSSSGRRGVDLKFTHAALYSKRTTRTRIVRDTRSVGATSHNPSQNSPSIIGTGVKGRMGSAVLGDYSTIAMQTLLTDKAESSDSSSGVTADAAGMADMSEGDTHSASTAAGADSESGSGSIGETVKSPDIGVVNTAYFVSLGFVTSVGDSESTNLIEVLSEKRSPNIGTELTCMIQCGDSLVFGGAHGFVGMGVGVPHRDGEGEAGNGVAVLCIFPPAFSPDSPTKSGYQQQEQEQEQEQHGNDDVIESKEPHPSSSSSSSRNPSSGPYDASVLRLRGHGYYSNITCLAASPTPIERDQDEEMSMYAAGDDAGGVSLWRMFRKKEAVTSPIDKSNTEPLNINVDRCRNEEEVGNMESDVHKESKLQSFLNVNYLIRSNDPRAEGDGEYISTQSSEERDKDGKKEIERISTLRFMPNSELLLVGTNKRLLLIVISTPHGPGYGPGTDSSINCENRNVWNASQPYGSPLLPFSPTARQQSLSHWLSHSPSPYLRHKQPYSSYIDTEYGVSFVSWVELDRVPSHCEGLFSVSVGESNSNRDTADIGRNVRYEEGSSEQCIILWKVVVEDEAARLRRDISDLNTQADASTNNDERPIEGPKTLDSNTALKESDSKIKNKERAGSIFSLPSLSFFNNASRPKPEQSPSASLITELNLNLRQEKELSLRKSRRNSSTNARSNFDVELDDASDCRVYRFKWTDEMFLAAFKNLKTISQAALEDHLSKYY